MEVSGEVGIEVEFGTKGFLPPKATERGKISSRARIGRVGAEVGPFGSHPGMSQHHRAAMVSASIYRLLNVMMDGGLGGT